MDFVKDIQNEVSQRVLQLYWTASLTHRLLAFSRRQTLDPRPTDVKKLKGRSAWRIWVGDYRVIYEIHDRVLQIIVITVGHRREIYR